MQTYAAISTCRREFLLRYFDDKWGACVNCDNCAANAGEYLPPELSGGDRREVA
jgi:superfamily II DNA helicase RecQ